MYTILTQTLIESGSLMCVNSLTHCTWNSSHFLANSILYGCILDLLSKYATKMFLIWPNLVRIYNSGSRCKEVFTSKCIICACQPGAFRRLLIECETCSLELPDPWTFTLEHWFKNSPGWHICEQRPYSSGITKATCFSLH